MRESPGVGSTCSCPSSNTQPIVAQSLRDGQPTAIGALYDSLMANLTPSSHFDVCELLHTFPEHSIRLSTKCSVSISFLPIIGRLSGIRPRLIPTISKTWVHRGGGFRFAIEISLGDGSFEKGELKTFNKNLGTKLKELEVF